MAAVTFSEASEAGVDAAEAGPVLGAVSTVSAAIAAFGTGSGDTAGRITCSGRFAGSSLTSTLIIASLEEAN